MGIVISITSGKGGTGKTTCCAAIGSFLAKDGRRTLCVDCDVALRNLDLVLGLGDRALWDFSDILEGRAAASEAILSHPEIPGLFFLAAPVGLSPSDIDGAAFRELIQDLSEEYDFVLLDSPAGIGSGFRLAAGAADAALIVVTSESTSLRDGGRTAEALRELGLTDIRLIVNRVRPHFFHRAHRTVDDLIDGVGARLIGVVSEDESVAMSCNLEVPLLIYGARYAYDEFRRIAARVAGRRVPLARL